MEESSIGLQGFGKYQELRGFGFPAQIMGYKSRNAGSIINTINARVKVAKSFKGIQLDGYKQPTVDGYSALFQVFLTYSAFEQFLKLNGFKYPSSVEGSLIKYNVSNVANQIRELDKDWKFTGFLLMHLDAKLQKALDSFKRGEMDNVAVVAATVRHIFVHGHMTAHARGARPKTIIPICELLSSFLLDFMDNEFSQNMEHIYAREEKKGLTRRLDRKKAKESAK